MDESSTSKNFFNVMHCVGDCPSPYGLSHLLQSPSGVTVFNQTLLLVMLLVWLFPDVRVFVCLGIKGKR